MSDTTSAFRKIEGPQHVEALGRAAALESKLLAANDKIAAVTKERDELQALVQVTREERDDWKRRATHHRDLGITLLDAKWLDPECHKSCQSLKLKRELSEWKSCADALADVVSYYVKYEGAHFDSESALDRFRELKVKK